MAEIELQPGEAMIDAWTLYYLPPEGGKYNGKLTVTDRRLIYVASDDASLGGVLAHSRARGRIEIEKSDISSIDVKRSLLSKKALLTLSDSSLHIFDRGAMSIDKIVAAIETS